MLHVEEPTGGGFACWVVPDRERLIVCTRGEVDLAVAREIQESLAEAVAAGFEVVVWNLDGVTFIDSAGMSVAHVIRRAAHAAGVQFTLEGCSRNVRRAFALAGLSDKLVFA